MVNDEDVFPFDTLVGDFGDIRLALLKGDLGEFPSTIFDVLFVVNFVFLTHKSAEA